MTTRHHNDGLRKRCRCPRRQWAKCPHPWSLNFKWAGRHYRLSLGPGFTSKTAARAEADRVREQIRSGTYGPQAATTAPVSLEQLMGIYFERYMRVHRARVSNEESSMRVILRTELPTAAGLLRAFKDWPITDITADSLERFKEARLATMAPGRGRVAINHNLMLLRSCFNWAIVPGGYLTATPFKIGPVTTVHLFPELPRERRLEPGEEERLMAACGPHLRALVEAALETVCRKGELLSLQWRQVRWAQNEIHLQGGKTKARKPRYMPISPRLHAVLEMRRLGPNGEEHEPDAYVFGNELGEPRVSKTIEDWWRKACARAQITDLHFHDLRREAASRLLEGGVPEQYVQQILDHADLTTTSRYLATTRKGLHQVMQQYEARVQQRANFSETGGSQRPSLAKERDTKAPETAGGREPDVVHR